MVGLAYELQHIHYCIDIGTDRLAQIRIEIGKARAVDDEIELAPQFVSDSGVNAEIRLRDVAFNYLHPLGNKLQKLVTVLRVKRIKHWRFVDELLEAALRRIRFLPPYEQINLSDFRQVHQSVREPDFADEAGDSDKHDVLAPESRAH